jgi:large subunit ribosomal protein L6
MSYIGKDYIIVPSNIKIIINNSFIEVEGQLGKLTKIIPTNILVKYINNNIFISIKDNNKFSNHINKSNWGLTKSLIFNMIKGTHSGFQMNLELVGIGYRAVIENNKLILKLGNSHSIIYNIPTSIFITIEDNTLIKINGVDKEFVTQVAANIRSFKIPEPYKGRGIKYLNEIIKYKKKRKK